ncbi:MAG: hypothetical protein SGPRY_009059, partial [Prymnesium sp.]
MLRDRPVAGLCDDRDGSSANTTECLGPRQLKSPPGRLQEKARKVTPHAREETRRVLVVFAGKPHVGDLRDAFERAGTWWTRVSEKQITTCHAVWSVREGAYQVVWLATPCSSFSVLHLDGSMPRLRSRASPEGLPGLTERQRLPAAPQSPGLDDNGAGESSVRGRGDVRGRKRSRSRDAELPSFLVENERSPGPRAARLQLLGSLQFEHSRHTRRAKGYDASTGEGTTESAEYPPLLCAVLAFLLGKSAGSRGGHGAWRATGTRSDDMLRAIYSESAKNRVASAVFLRFRMLPDMAIGPVGVGEAEGRHITEENTGTEAAATRF